MTLTLTHLTDLQRVRVALSGLPDGSVQVQRALNGSATDALWQQGIVRSGRQLAIQSGVGQLDDYEWFADVANHYRVVAVNPPPGLALDGASGAYASTPDAASLDITGDLDLRVEAARSDGWDPPSRQSLVSKFVTGTNQRSYRLAITDAGRLQLVWSTTGLAGGVASASSTVAITAPSSGRLAVRATIDVDDGASGRIVRFYTAPTIAGPWTPLGDPVTGVSTSIFAGTATLEVGSISAGTGERWTGSIVAVQVRNGIGGTAVANPTFAGQTPGTSSFADAAGNTWTVNGTATILGQILETGQITPSLDGQVWIKSIRYPLLNTPVIVADYGDIDQDPRNAAYPVEGRSLPIGLADARGGRNFELILATDTDAEDRHLDLVLRASSELFIHVPATGDCALLPGSLYALPGRSVKHRVAGVSPYHNYPIPLTEVSPPPPDIVGTTLTWGTVERLYGSWAALVGANPTWRDLLATVGSPNDPVVI